MTANSRGNLLLLVLVQISNCFCWAADPWPPFGFMCNSSETLHIIWPVRSNESSGNAGRNAGFRVCLSYYNSYADHWHLIVLTSSTMSTLSSLNGTLQHVAFKIPSEYMRCQFFYSWKIQPITPKQIPSLLRSPAGDSTENCATSTPAQQCEMELGRHRGCPGWRPPQSNTLDCQPDLSDRSAASYSSLFGRLCRSRSASTVAWFAPVAAVAGCILIAAAGLALARVLARRESKRISKRIANASRPTDAANSSVTSPASIFNLLSDGAKLRRVVENYIWRSPQFMMKPLQQRLEQQRTTRFSFLLTNPDTGELLNASLSILDCF